MTDFTASVQYNDFVGTAAADRSDQADLINDLRHANKANQDEHIAGYRIACGSGNQPQVKSVDLVVYLRKGDYDPQPKKLRAVRHTMPIEKFFSYFKRFEIVLMQKEVSFSGVQVTGP